MTKRYWLMWALGLAISITINAAVSYALDLDGTASFLLGVILGFACTAALTFKEAMR